MGSAKGITAREAYVKLMQQQPAQVSSAIRSAAAAEMGVDIASPPSSLMRSYVERKMVIGDHRQLALFAHYLAHCWEAARESGNEEMEYWMSRGLLMVDQFGVDQGRTTMGWLLAALPDPLWSQLQRRRVGLKPLCSAGLGSLDSSELCVSEGLRLPRGTPQECGGDHHNHPRGSAGRGRRRQRGQAEKASATSSQDRPDGRHHCLKHACLEPRVERGPLDLWSGFAASTQHKMRKALSGFEAWVEDRLGVSLEQALCNVEAAALALRGYGFYLYEQGFPRYLLVYAITAVQDMHPAYRSHLTPAWQVDKKWQAVEPGECRPVISQPIVCAAVSTSLLWEWYDWAAVTIIGFLCMMHPAEFVFLRRSDLVFPSDALSNDRSAYVHIRHPKTARFARRQHCRLEDPVALTFLESLYLRLPWDARLFRGSPHVYRSQWNAVMSRLQVPHTLHEKGATPGVLEQRFFI